MKYIDLSVKFLATIFVLLMLGAVGLTVWLQDNDSEQLTREEQVTNDIETKLPINGINVLYYRPTDIDDFAQYSNDFVARLTGFGTTHIAIAMPFFMDNNAANAVNTTSETPTVEDIELLIQSAQSQGVNVIIKPLIDSKSEDFVRQNIAPTDVDAWFASYQAQLLPYVELSERYNLTGFTVGVELSSLQTYSFKWSALIAELRKSFTGNMTYAANWDATVVPFSADLDYVGVDAYYSYDGPIDNAQLKVFWHDLLDSLPESEDPGYIVHEYGIPSEQGSNVDPWKGSDTGIVDQNLQDAWIRAACDVIHQRTRGGYIWSAYFGTDLDKTREDELSYNILGKPQVENTVRDCFNWY